MITLTKGGRFESVATEIQASAFINNGWVIAPQPTEEAPPAETEEEKEAPPVETQEEVKPAPAKPKRTGGRKKTEV